MRHAITLRIGPATFRIGSAWSQPIAQLRRLYAAYPDVDGAIADFTVRLQPTSLLRRFLRPSIFITGDHGLADAAPMSLAHGLLAAEMGMNLQMALGWRRHLLLHASSVEKNGRVLVMTGESGSGKSTLAALLGERGWRFMGDEFALLDLQSGAILPFPRLVSLKNQAIGVVADAVGDARMGPLLAATAKGDIRHMMPRADAVARMDQGGMPALLLFPRFGHEAAVRELGQGEIFMRLTQASTNYVTLGEPAFAGLTRFVTAVPARAIDFPSGEAAFAMVDRLWEELA
ncbi:HprK-related kinase A [Sphingobium sp.]|uniref:HprK-related kinase A n=1 Tax=Sphingobium sp. TaxID=1912891 RepID=UPI00261D8520|nr:HprK-related kinase A [Sphingobium sp.]